MMTLAASVVQVVTSGVDWPAVAAAIAGGVVGLAGIGVTVWQSSKSIGAEETRIKLNEKRRAYARFHASLDNVFATATLRTEESTPEERLSNFFSALPAMYNAASELRLIASPKVATQARNVAAKLAKEASAAIQTPREIDKNNEIYNMREQLYALMRADLGEPSGGGELLPRAPTS